MNIKVSLKEKPKLYVKKSLKKSLSKNTMSTMDILDEESQKGKNTGNCLTSANQEHSILNDLLNSNYFNNSINLETIGITNRFKFNLKTLELIREAIKYHLANVTLFPIFRFNKGFTIVFHDQNNKLNDFVKEFVPYYTNHYYSKLLSRLKTRFKVINSSKVAYLMKIFDKKPGIYFGRPLYGLKENLNNENGKGKKIATMNPIVTMELLTKIPNKHPDKIIKNRRLEMQYGKAKEAAIGIRRLEYAYNMKKGFMFNKMLLQKNVITIQKWWRTISRSINEFFVVSHIQSHYRGHLSRMALCDSLHVIDDILPFIYKIENIMTRNKIEYFFNLLYLKFAYLAVYNKMSSKIEMIKRNIKAYIIRKEPKIEFRKQYIIRHNIIKKIYELSTQEKIDLLQSTTKSFLLNHNNKIMLGLGYNVHPFLYFKLKYSKNSKEIYKKKIVKFHRFINKLQLFNLKVNHKVPNAFEYLRIILTRKHFNELGIYDKADVYNRKIVLMNKFVNSLVKGTKFQQKYADIWYKNTQDIIRQDKVERLTKRIKSITTVKNSQTIAKYYNIWKTKKTLVYQMILLFKKIKIANRNVNINQAKKALLNELFSTYHSYQYGQKDIELKNSVSKWKNKVIQLQKRDLLISKAIKNSEQRITKELLNKSLRIFIDKCNAKKRASLIEKALLNKANREYTKLEKYFKLWKQHCQYRILHSIFFKTMNKTQSTLKNKINQLNAKSKGILKRNDYLRNSIEYINDFALLKQNLSLYRNKTKQISEIEVSIKELVNHFGIKNNTNKLKIYYSKWRISTLMNRLLINSHNKWLLNHLNRWKIYSNLLISIKHIIAKKDRLDTFLIRKYFNHWKKYNEVYIKVILPYFLTKTKLFIKILSEPINKIRTIYKTLSFVYISNKAIENKFEIVSQLRKAILNRHCKDIQIYAAKWKKIKNNIIHKENISQRIDYLLKYLFSACTLRYSLHNLERYFTKWEMKAPYYLRISVLNKQNKHKQLLQLYYSKWKKQAFKYKLSKASDVITNRVKERNHFRQFCSKLNNIFIKKLIQGSVIIKTRREIKMKLYKNIFTVVLNNIRYRNQLKSLTRLSDIANKKFKFSLHKWKLKAKRIGVIQQKFYTNVFRRIATNYKKSVLCDLLKKVKGRREAQKGIFFKKYKKAAGVYYIKCFHFNSQVFFLYKQKKFLAKRKYRMIKYVINQLNRKLIKHQSLKRYLCNWRRAIRYNMLIDCINNRIKLLENGFVAFRVLMKRWMMY